MRTLRTNDFEIGFLEGWRDSSQIVLIGPERPAFTPNIQVHREEVPTESIDEFFRQQRAELSSLAGFRLLDHGERTLGGQQALHHSYSWDLPEQPGLRVRQQQVVVIRGDSLLTITSSALEQDWELVEGGFELALSHFKFV